MNGTLGNDTNKALRRLRKAAGYTTLLVATASMLAGCMSFGPRSLDKMEQALMESNPNLVIASSIKFGIGALTLDFVDFAFVHDRSIDVSKISRADIGVYELRNTLTLEDFKAPTDGSGGQCPRRDVIVRVREDDSYVDIVACIKDDNVTGLSMFVLEPKGIVVINTRGDFDSILRTMVKSSMGGGKRAKKHRDDGQRPTVAEQDAGVSLPSS